MARAVAYDLAHGSTRDAPSGGQALVQIVHDIGMRPGANAEAAVGSDVVSPHAFSDTAGQGTSLAFTIKESARAMASAAVAQTFDQIFAAIGAVGQRRIGGEALLGIIEQVPKRDSPTLVEGKAQIGFGGGAAYRIQRKQV